jgi:23S rRNA pseudouridine1911/1915/1917 synthase
VQPDAASTPLWPRRLFPVGASSAGRRLDLFLAEACPELSRSRIQRLIAAGDVLVNAAPARRPSAPVRAGDRVALSIPPATRSELVPEEIPLRILYEDDDLIAIDKSAGLVVHPAPGHPSGTLVNAILHHCRGRLSGIGGTERPGIVHRLDRDTTGVLIVARSDLAHRKLASQMKRRTMRKEYVALVAGIPRVRKGEIALDVGRDPRDRKRMKAHRRRAGERVPHGFREAHTLYELEREWPAAQLALLRCRLVTGRTHQIRVHLAASGMPVIGDPVYGHPRYDRLNDAAIRGILRGFPRQALHAECVVFRHPATGEEMTIRAPIPEDLRQLIEAIDARYG